MMRASSSRTTTRPTMMMLFLLLACCCCCAAPIARGGGGGGGVSSRRRERWRRRRRCGRRRWKEGGRPGPSIGIGRPVRRSPRRGSCEAPPHGRRRRRGRGRRRRGEGWRHRRCGRWRGRGRFDRLVLPFRRRPRLLLLLPHHPPHRRRNLRSRRPIPVRRLAPMLRIARVRRYARRSRRRTLRGALRRSIHPGRHRSTQSVQLFGISVRRSRRTYDSGGISSSVLRVYGRQSRYQSRLFIDQVGEEREPGRRRGGAGRRGCVSARQIES
mmetsp:Transcript_19283/g.56243  ORF Transcript_19283/g.56243 Transcript_19283/m.56243 type:complete len:270 (+) Transcript_19283:292-1101(+)